MLVWSFRKKDVVFHSMFWACIVLLYLARSTWAILSVGVGFSYYYQRGLAEFATRDRRLALIAGATLTLLVIIVVLIKVGPWQTPLYRASDRWSWWLAGWHMFLRYPMTGVGPGSYGAAYSYFAPRVLINTIFVHNCIIQWLSETGLIGLSAIGMFISAYVLALREQTENPRRVPWVCRRRHRHFQLFISHHIS